MILTLACSAVLAAEAPSPVGELDAKDGVTVVAQDRALLPSGRGLGSIADVWLVEVMTLQNGRGDLARFDPLWLSAHGRSRLQLVTTLNGLDLTDPARPGTPLFEVPFAAWDRVTFTSLYGGAPGFHYRLGTSGRARAEGGTGRTVGGPLLLPSGLMDREPATRKGVTEERRELSGPLELTADVGQHASGAPLRVVLEHLEHSHSYPTLVAEDEAERTTALVVALAGGWLLTGGWQLERRSHEGAQFRWPDALTLEREGQAFVAGVERRFTPSATAELRLTAGLTLRRDDEAPNTASPVVTDLEGEWLYLARPRFAEDLRRSQAHAGLELRFGDSEAPVTFSVRGSRAALASTPHVVGGRRGVTYDGNFDGAGTPAGTYIVDYGSTGRAEEVLTSVRLGIEAARRLGEVQLTAYAAWDYAAAESLSGPGVTAPAPAAGVYAVLPIGEAELFATASHEPERLTAEVAAALDPARPFSYRYRWSDDGDLVPEASERGELIERRGARFRRLGEDVARPAASTVAVGVQSAPFGRFRANLRGIGRLLTNRYVLRLADERGYTARAFRDPGGDGRGEEVVAGGGQRFTVYERDPETFGAERYVLENAVRSDFYWGLEGQLLSLQREPWFLTVSGTAYLSAGSAPFGSFADRNDPGIIDEGSAELNERVNNRGRYDHDRSYGLHVLSGVTPLEGLWLSAALRYRDGQPFTRLVVVDDLPQGPTAVMAVRRGRPRHTFHMELDVRATYELELAGFSAQLALDVLNALGSGTELLEDPRTGPTYRDPLEMVPGRAVFATLVLEL